MLYRFADHSSLEESKQSVSIWLGFSPTDLALTALPSVTARLAPWLYAPPRSQRPEKRA